MSQVSPAKLKVPTINQVAICVHDLEQVSWNFWNILGMGPWEIYDWEFPLINERKYYGKREWGRDRISLFRAGKLQVELVQPVEGKSLYRDWLEQKGEGLHHFNFLVDDIKPVQAAMEEMGFPCIQTGYYGFTPDKRTTFSYHETTPALRILWEPVALGGQKTVKPLWVPATIDPPSPARFQVKAINQVGMVVKNLEETCWNYWNLLGIGPWEVYSRTYPYFYDRKYHGKTTYSKERVAMARVGEVLFEMVQPLEGKSADLDFLNQHGEVLHYLNVPVDDLDTAAATLTEMGYPSLQSARFGKPQDKSGFSYHYIPALRAIFRVEHAGGVKGVPSTWIPGPPTSA
jgi:catechol 2,3-dioxygenase-like lactoylglutathione lyase family enzyme